MATLPAFPIASPLPHVTILCSSVQVKVLGFTDLHFTTPRLPLLNSSLGCSWPVLPARLIPWEAETYSSFTNVNVAKIGC